MKTYGTLGLNPSHGYWIMQAAPHVAMRAKRIFGKISKNSVDMLTLTANAETARDLEWFIERYPLDMSTEDRKRLCQQAKSHRDMIARLEDLFDPNYQPTAFNLRIPPRTYQMREAEVYLANGALLIGDDVGLGKTVAGICSFTDPRTLPAVVVTLAHLPRQWRDEIIKFAPDLYVWSPNTATPHELPTFMGRGPDVIVLNYHKLQGWAQVLGAYCKSIVFDEVQELRHRGTGKYSAAEYICEQVAFRLGLSATPIYNYGGEIYSVFNLLKPGCLGTWSEFLTEWCVGPGTPAPMGDSTMDGTAAAAKAILARQPRLKDPKAFGTWAREQFLMVRHTRKDVGRELPEVIRIPQHVDSDHHELSKIENTAAELAMLILQQGERVRGEKWQAAEQLSTLLRQATGIAKAPFVADFVRLLVEAGEKVVLFGWHREVYTIWQTKLADLRPVLFTGSETAAEKDRSKRAFMNGETPVMIMSLRSGAGLNGLEQVSSCAVFGELDWSPGVHEQCIGRLNRDGQQNPVVAYFLTADEGADPEIAATLGLKRQQVEGIRNPTEDFLEKLELDGAEFKRLASSYLKQIGIPVPTAPEAVCP